MMTSPAEQEYWHEFLRRLADTPLVDLATEYGAATAELDAALAATTGDRPVQKEAWWPVVLRLHERGSLRELARRFGTNPRRLRRGLARAAVRVHGEAVAEEGLSRFEPIRERLGKEPDKTLAAEIGVTVEAIKGERRRLRIEPYRMRPDAEEWGEKVAPKREKVRPRRRWQDAPEPEVYRRAGSASPAPAEPAPVVEHPAPVVTRTAFRRMGTDEEEAAGPEAIRTGTFGGFAGADDAATESFDGASRAPAERPRRRIVRPSQPESEEPSSPTALPRLSRAAPASTVRLITPSEGPSVPAGTGVSSKAPAQRPPARRRTVSEARPAAAPTPAPAEQAAPELDLPPEADAVTLALVDALVEPLPAATPEEASGEYAWQVKVPGRPQPLLVVADDIADALQIASEHLGSDVVAEARAWRLGAVLREET